MKTTFCKVSCLVFLFAFLFGCTAKNDLPSKKYTYGLYAAMAGDVAYIPFDINTDGTVSAGTAVLLKYAIQNKNVTSISEVSYGRVYCTVKSYGVDYLSPLDMLFHKDYSNRIIVLGDGKEMKEIETGVDTSYISSIYNPDLKLAYFLWEKTDSGIPVSIVDTEDDTEKTIHSNIPGKVKGYDISDGEIFFAVTNEDEIEGVPDNFLFRMNTYNLQNRIVTKNGINTTPSAIKILPDGNVCVLSNTFYSDKNALCIYKKNGMHLWDVPLGLSCENIIIDKDGMAYLSVRDRDKKDDGLGDSLVVFDTAKREATGSITGFKGPESMVLKDNYLFALNTKSNKISIVDTAKRRIMSELSPKGRGGVDSFVVVKN